MLQTCRRSSYIQTLIIHTTSLLKRKEISFSSLKFANLVCASKPHFFFTLIFIIALRS